ncbi:hypothetical protein GCM10022237_30090 [Nocardioides ginsengisoli]|uniref:DUF2742 domain-containing protein n=1 Tax=Nocardioides ginsengisoli TaxID=363868 RepID=A0ABW3VTZ9_9ACTN
METDEERPDCPRWCVTSAAEHADEDPGTWLHEGPRFGVFRTWWQEGPGAASSFMTTIDEPVAGAHEHTSDDLRRLAADALDAAMWLDRQARTQPTEHGVSVVELVKRAHAEATRSA